MSELKQLALTVVSSTSVDFNTTDDNTLYTVPPGKSFVPIIMVIRSISANMTSAVISAGKSDAKTDFIPNTTCSGASATTKMLILKPGFNATPAVGYGLMTVMGAGTTFVLDNVTAAGIACTGTVDLIGYLF